MIAKYPGKKSFEKVNNSNIFVKYLCKKNDAELTKFFIILLCITYLTMDTENTRYVIYSYYHPNQLLSGIISNTQGD